MRKLIQRIALVGAIFLTHCVYSAVTGKVCEYLETYDQLANYTGKPGLYVVRDAGNTHTGQHGDPTVNKGWAIYIWDSSVAGGWVKMAEQESLDMSNKELIFNNYYDKEQINAIIDDVTNSIPGSAAMDARLIKVETATTTLSNNINTVNGQITELWNETDRLNTRINNIPSGGGAVDPTITNDVARLKTGQQDLSNRVNTVETTIDKITNNTTHVEIGSRDSVTLRNVRDVIVAMSEAKATIIGSSGPPVSPAYNNVIDVTEMSGMSRYLSISLRPDSLNVLVCTNASAKPGPLVTLYPQVPGNFELFVPNNQELREKLPITFDFDNEDGVHRASNLTYNVGRVAWKLPVLMRGIKPCEGFPITVMTQSLDDHTDWRPVIDDCHLLYDSALKRFYTDATHKAAIGKNLHCAKSFKLTYHSTTGSDVTLVKDTPGSDGYIDYGFYGYISSMVLPTTDSVLFDSSDKTTVTIVVETENGSATWTGPISR